MKLEQLKYKFCDFVLIFSILGVFVYSSTKTLTIINPKLVDFQILKFEVSIALKFGNIVVGAV